MPGIPIPCVGRRTITVTESGSLSALLTISKGHTELAHLVIERDNVIRLISELSAAVTPNPKPKSKKLLPE